MNLWDFYVINSGNVKTLQSHTWITFIWLHWNPCSYSCILFYSLYFTSLPPSIPSAIQSLKILLVPQKCEIIVVLSNIKLSIAPCKVIALNLLCFNFDISSLIRSLITHSKVVALCRLRGDSKNLRYFSLMPVRA